MTRPTETRFLGPQDREWPAALHKPSARDAAPLGLWARGQGDLDELLRRAVVVLGAAAATPYAVAVAHGLAAELAGAGWTVVTSGAAGVASAARHGVFSAGHPAVVLPLGGVARPQPPGHARQYERVTWTGLPLSDSYGPPADVRADGAMRNRLLSVLGAAVVLIEPSGIAVDVAHRSRARGLPIFAVPGPVTTDSGSAAAHRLVRDGTARLVRDARDVLSDLGDER